jgi:U4/U6 small nuclear ribonucleoprotein PRP3
VLQREAPPAAEWWDEPLLPNNTYDDLALGMGALNIGTSDSPITIYVQHPIPIPAPGDKAKPALKPLKLTTKEQKKMRKSKRAAALQDHRDRVRMGLIPPDPPKGAYAMCRCCKVWAHERVVRLANLMKVLTSDAVQDPTKVEARVRREVAMRKHTHEKTNAERKLTDDQRREKIEEKKTNEEKKGVWGAVFRLLPFLGSAAHR